jgi:hypothetical protein
MLWTGLLCWKEGPALSSRLAAIPERVLVDGEYWRLWTALAVHADLPHFAFNALFFACFSFLLYGYFGVWVYPVWSFSLLKRIRESLPCGRMTEDTLRGESLFYGSPRSFVDPQRAGGPSSGSEATATWPSTRSSSSRVTPRCSRCTPAPTTPRVGRTARSLLADA